MKPTLTWQEDNFELLERVGRGGYGSVYKVRNKLDDRIYALKKIKLARVDLQDISDETQKVLKEARTLSLLNHPNILRYYGTWLQHGVDNAGTFDSAEKGLRNSDGSYSPDARHAPSRPDSFIHPLKLNPVPQTAAEHEFFLRNSLRRVMPGTTAYTAHTDKESLKSHSFVEIESPSLLPNKYDRASQMYMGKESFTTVEEDDEGYSTGGDSFLQPVAPTKAKKGNEDYLFIQTEYCDLTLESYLDERGDLIKKCQKMHSANHKLLRYDLEVHPLVMYESFSLGLQLISALKYIHSRQNLIHRDLKPTNIFLNNRKSRLEVKLGDFGLVKKLKNVIPDSPFLNTM